MTRMLGGWLGSLISLGEVLPYMVIQGYRFRSCFYSLQTATCSGPLRGVLKDSSKLAVKKVPGMWCNKCDLIVGGSLEGVDIGWE